MSTPLLETLIKCIPVDPLLNPMHINLFGHINKCETIITNTKEGFVRKTFLTVSVIDNKQTRYIQCVAWGQCSTLLEANGLIGKSITVQGIIDENTSIIRATDVHIL